MIGLTISAPPVERAGEVLTPTAMALLARLHARFNAERLELLSARAQRQAELDAGALPEFLSAAAIQTGDWQVAPAPADLVDRRVGLVGPPDRDTVINALNAPTSVFVADFEDSCAPTWPNLIRGQLNLADALHDRIQYCDPVSGRQRRPGAGGATLVVRPRGWHLPEKHVCIDGEPVAAALFDFAVYLANNFESIARRGSGPYFHLPKLESYQEARLWNEVFIAAQEALGVRRGSIRATVLIETLPAAFQMEEILHELREHAIGLSCGRWNYLFSFIKSFSSRPEYLLPDRDRVTMQCHLLRSYVDLMTQTCHRRGAYAIGATAGNRLQVLHEERRVTRDDLLRVPDGEITERGLRACIRVGIQYLEAWLRGIGCVPLYHVMEDTASAEICRAQLWQCLRHGARLSDGTAMTVGRFDRWLVEEVDRLHDEVGPARLAAGVFPTAARVFEALIKQERFEEFLTLCAYEHLP